MASRKSFSKPQASWQTKANDARLCYTPDPQTKSKPTASIILQHNSSKMVLKQSEFAQKKPTHGRQESQPAIMIAKRQRGKELRIVVTSQHNRKHDSSNSCTLPQPKLEIPYRSLFFGPGLTYEKVLKHLTVVHKGLLYSQKSLKQPTSQFIESKKVALPTRPTGKTPLYHSTYSSLLLVSGKTKTLVLDLDETLIHSCSMVETPDVVVNSKLSKEHMRVSLLCTTPQQKHYQ